MGAKPSLVPALVGRLSRGRTQRPGWLTWSIGDRVFVTLSCLAIVAGAWVLSPSRDATLLFAVIAPTTLAMHTRLAVGGFHGLVLLLLSAAGLVLVGIELRLTGTVIAVGLAGMGLIARYGQRSRILRVGAGLALLAGSLTLAGRAGSGVVLWSALLRDAAAAAAGGFGSVLLMLALDPLLDAMFGHATRLTLSEWLSLEHPLLRELARTAPGTLQHSVNVGVLAAAAAQAIRADALLVRVGGLYHDVGKSAAPSYFIENQDGHNPHDLLDPHESARIFRAHVTDGVARVLAHGMGERLAIFVREHHGTSVMRLLQAKASDQAGGAPADEEPFRYPGPRPRSRETGILMVADQVEATARSAPPADMAACQDIVQRTIARIQAAGELAESGLSAAEIEAIERALERSVHAMYHRRVAYPAVGPGMAAGTATPR